MSEHEPTLKDISEKLDFIISLHTSRTRKTRRTFSETTDRPQEMLKVFDYLATLTDMKKQQQRFPVGTYFNGINKDHIEIVPRSILINRASMRGAFKPTKDEVMSKSAAAIAEEALEELLKDGKLVEARLDNTKIPTTSHVVCVFSLKWAAKAGVVGYEGVVIEEETEEKRVPLAEFLKAHKKSVATPAQWSPDLMKKPAVGVSREEGKDKEQKLIRQMQEAEKDGRLDDDVVLERGTSKKKIEL